jgi:hypothetical protein
VIIFDKSMDRLPAWMIVAAGVFVVIASFELSLWLLELFFPR